MTPRFAAVDARTGRFGRTAVMGLTGLTGARLPPLNPLLGLNPLVDEPGRERDGGALGRNELGGGLGREKLEGGVERKVGLETPITAPRPPMTSTVAAIQFRIVWCFMLFYI